MAQGQASGITTLQKAGTIAQANRQGRRAAARRRRLAFLAFVAVELANPLIQ